MADLASIYNGALIHLGLAPIDDPDGSDEPATILRARYAAVRDYVLRDHPWNCAAARGWAEAAAAADLPPFEYSNAYKLSTDPYCLRVRALVGVTTKWEVEGRLLLCNAAPPLAIKFTKRLTDPELFDPMLAEGISLYLAYACSTKLTNRSGRRAELKTSYAAFISDAKGVDGQEGTPPEVFSSDFLDARL